MSADTLESIGFYILVAIGIGCLVLTVSRVALWFMPGKKGKL